MKIIDIMGKSQADPYVIESGGNYYLYCTGIGGVECYKSRSLFSGWEYVGVVCREEGRKEYWAPSVIEDNGTFYMYYSCMPEEENDPHTQNIRVAASARPDGGFKLVKELLPPFSIDAHAVKNADGLYMFYSVNDYGAERAGTYIVCDKMKDFFTPCGEPRAIVKPTLDEEIFQRDRFEKGRHWHTVEGAFYFYKDGWHYCIYSGNCYENPAYHLGYAACKSDSLKLNGLKFEKVLENGKFSPLVAANATEASTGHNSLVEADGKLYLVYHGRDIRENGERAKRTARVCELIANGGKLTVVRS